MAEVWCCCCEREAVGSYAGEAYCEEHLAEKEHGEPDPRESWPVDFEEGE